MKSNILNLYLSTYFIFTSNVMAVGILQDHTETITVHNRASYSKDLEAYGCGFGTALIDGKSISSARIEESLNFCNKFSNAFHENSKKFDKKFDLIETRIKRELSKKPNHELQIKNFEDFIKKINKNKQESIFLLQSIYERMMS